MVVMYTAESILIAGMSRRQGCRPLYGEQSAITAASFICSTRSDT